MQRVQSGISTHRDILYSVSREVELKAKLKSTCCPSLLFFHDPESQELCYRSHWLNWTKFLFFRQRKESRSSWTLSSKAVPFLIQQLKQTKSLPYTALVIIYHTKYSPNHCWSDFLKLLLALLKSCFTHILPLKFQQWIKCIVFRFYGNRVGVLIKSASLS